MLLSFLGLDESMCKTPFSNPYPYLYCDYPTQKKPREDFFFFFISLVLERIVDIFLRLRTKGKEGEEWHVKILGLWVKKGAGGERQGEKVRDLDEKDRSFFAL